MFESGKYAHPAIVANAYEKLLRRFSESTMEFEAIRSAVQSALASYRSPQGSVKAEDFAQCVIEIQRELDAVLYARRNPHFIFAHLLPEHAARFTCSDLCKLKRAENL